MGKIEEKQIPAEAILAQLLMARLPLAHLVKHLPEALTELSLRHSCCNKQIRPTEIPASRWGLAD